MNTKYDLSQLEWKVSGWIPHLWRLQATMEIGASPAAEIMAVPAKVPGSVQYSLREAGLIPDWNKGAAYRECQWVENQHWIYETALPEEWFGSGKTYTLNCMGLDYAGTLILNGKPIGEFCGTFTPYEFDLTPHLGEGRNVLQIVFEMSPRWLGQIGYTSKMKEWKTRFNYTWDWTIRLMQIGIWDDIFIEATDGKKIDEFRCVADADVASGTGSLKVWGRASAGEGATVDVKLSKDGKVVKEETLPAAQFTAVGLSWTGLPVELWWANMMGDQPLYTLDCVLSDKDGNTIDSTSRCVGFRNVSWAACEGAPAEADPWICVVNGKSVFLQGINWVPILPNHADVTEADYRKRLELYKDLGLNILRVWGGAVLEKETFYDICDELGIMVWQEFPLSSSGVDNYPPDDEKSINDQARFAKSYIKRRQHHASLIIWCGGNELMWLDSRPLDAAHPMIARFKKVVEENDPTRHFLATSSTGPKFGADAKDYGKGLHWDVHGPWKLWGTMDEWAEYWNGDDALFRSESGCPGTSSVEIIRQYAGDLDEQPIDVVNPFWRRPMNWWTEPDQFAIEMGRAPETVDEYVEWSQARQTKALTIAVSACKNRFPRCGGIILWMGHDCYPCTGNTSVVDFHGDPKPAALALKEIWRR